MLNRRFVREYGIITLGTIIIAAAVFFFMQPSHVTVGSASGLAIVISNFLLMPVSAITFIINAVLLIIGFWLIGPEFGAKTVYASVLLPAVMRVFEVFFPDFSSITQDPFLDMLCYILVVGVGLAMLFSCNASSGGLDIVSKLMNKYLHMELERRCPCLAWWWRCPPRCALTRRSWCSACWERTSAEWPSITSYLA